MFLDQQQVRQQEQGGQRGQRRHVQGEEAAQCSPGHILSTAQVPRQFGADERNVGGHIRPHFGGEVGDLVPRQQIAAKAKRQSEPQQRNAAQPRQLPRLAVSVQEYHAEHMDKSRQDHQIRRPAMHGADKPAKLHLCHDELDTLVGLPGRGAVVKQEHDPSHYLNEK